jgi:hypothetical protein
MDINVNVHITGLEPLIAAINNLVTGQAAAAKIADEAVGKAKETSRKGRNGLVTGERRTEALEERAKEVPADEPPEATTSATPTSAPESAAPKESATSSAAPADTVAPELTDEAMRSLTAEKAKINRALVKGIVTKYGSSVTEVPLARRAELRAELEAVTA